MLFSELFSLAEDWSEKLPASAIHLHIGSSFHPVLQNSCLCVSAANQTTEPS